MKARLCQFSLVLLALPMVSQIAAAQGTAFTYQGRLADGGGPANGAYDFTFSLYATNIGGSALPPMLTNTGVLVSNGLFAATLDFSNVFNGAPFWLEIGVRSNAGPPGFNILSPRQNLTATPYAITAGNLSGPLSAGALAGYGGTVTFTNPANAFAGNGAGLTNLAASGITGLDTNHFVLTSDPRAVSLGNTNNTFVGTIYGPQNLGNPASGHPAFSNGYFTFMEEKPGFGLWYNLTHGSTVGNGAEWQWTPNQMYLGPNDGNHIQLGLATHWQDAFYMQKASTNMNGPSPINGASHQFGFSYSWSDSSHHELGQDWWNLRATNYDNATGDAYLNFYAPTLGSDANEYRLGTVALSLDSKGAMAKGSFKHRFQVLFPSQTTNYFVSYTNAQFAEIDAVGAVNLLETNVPTAAVEAIERDLYIYPGAVSRALSTPTNWLWESESGLAAAPTSLPASNVMHVQLTMMANAPISTNVVANYKLAPYVIPYSPASDLAVVEWLKADILPLGNGDPVSTWTAAIGKDAAQSGVSRGTFSTSAQNGLPAIIFFTGQYMRTPAFASPVSQPDTMWLVARFTSVTSDLMTDGIDGSSRQIFRIEGDNHFGFASPSDIEGGAADTNWHIVEIQFNGATSAMRIDHGAPVAGNSGSAGLAGLTIAAHYLQAVAGNCEIAEIVVKSGLPADEEAEWSYYNKKWAVY